MFVERKRIDIDGLEWSEKRGWGAIGHANHAERASVSAVNDCFERRLSLVILQGRMWGRLQDASLASNPATHEEHGAAQSGRRAESSVTLQLASSRALFGDLHVWHSLRVPLGRGRREIDHVVLDAGGLHVLEIKHWSGSVHLEGGEWVQARTNGSTVRHGDVVATHEAKVRALLDFLRAKGIELPAAAVHRRILLTNPSCTLSAEVSCLEGVLSCDSVATYMSTFEQSILSNVASRLLPRSLGGRRLDAAQVRRAHRR